MSDMQIPNMGSAVNLTGPEEIEIVQGGSTYKATVSQIVALVKAGEITRIDTTAPITGGTVTSGTATIGLATSGVDNAHLAHMPARTVKGNALTTTAAPTDIKLDLTWFPTGGFKQACRLVSVVNIPLSSLQNIDGITGVTGDRVLVAGQTNAAQNGIYVMAVAAWTRATDADAGAELYAATVGVTDGTTYGGTQWATGFKLGNVVGTDPMVWGQLARTDKANTFTANQTIQNTAPSLTLLDGDALLAGTTPNARIKFFASDGSLGAMGYNNSKYLSLTNSVGNISLNAALAGSFINFDIGGSTRAQVDPTGALSADNSIVTRKTGDLRYAPLTGGATSLFSDGTVTNPSIAFANEPDTGFFHPVGIADQFALTAGGVEQMRFGKLNLFYRGTTAAITNLTANTVLAGKSGAETAMANVMFGTAVAGPQVHLGHSHNAAIGAYTLPSALDDQMGMIQFSGSDTAKMMVGASIRAYADAAGLLDKVPGRLSFWTFDTALRERLRIASTGVVSFWEGADVLAGRIDPAGPAIVDAHTIITAEKGDARYSKSSTVEGGNLFPDYNMLDDAFYASSTGAAYTLLVTAQPFLGRRYINIPANAAVMRVETDWFPIEPSMDYLVHGYAWCQPGSAGAVTSTIYAETASDDGTGVATSLGQTVVHASTGAFVVGGGANISLTTPATARLMRFVCERSAGSTALGRFGALKVEKKARAATIMSDLDLTMMPMAGFKQSVHQVADTNINLATGGLPTFDGFALTAGNRVLCVGQTLPTENGIYIAPKSNVAPNNVWVRAADADAGAEVKPQVVGVQRGTKYGATLWQSTFQGNDVVGTTNMLWYQLVRTDLANVFTANQIITNGGPALSLTDSNTAVSGIVSARIILNGSDGQAGVVGFNGVGSNLLIRSEQKGITFASDVSNTSAGAAIAQFTTGPTETARVEAAGTIITAATAIVTKEKGDNRYLKSGGNGVLASDLNISTGSNVYPDYNMADPDFYASSTGVAYTFYTTNSAPLGLRYIGIPVDAALQRVETDWFPIEPSTDYLIRAGAWMQTAAVGAGTATAYVETASDNGSGVITSLGLTTVITRTDTLYGPSGQFAEISLTTPATGRWMRFVGERAAGGTQRANFGGLRVEKKARYGAAGFQLADGTALLPSLTFTSDLTTGIYSDTVGSIKFTTNADWAMSLTATNLLYFGSQVDMIGGSLPANRINIQGGQTAPASIGITLNNAAGTNSPKINFGRSLGSTAYNRYDAVATNTILGDVRFHGADGTTQVYAADVRGYVVRTPVAGTVIGGLQLMTGSGPGAAAVRMDIDDVFIECKLPVKTASYTKTTLPAAATAGAGSIAWCSNAVGGAALVSSNGTAWFLAGTQIAP